jgi:predicted nucleic acid-binding protein
MLALAGEVVELTDEIEARAATFVKRGIKPMDALHLASASATKADYFCTCDDKLLKQSKKLKSLDTKVVSPLELIAEVTS